MKRNNKSRVKELKQRSDILFKMAIAAEPKSEEYNALVSGSAALENLAEEMERHINRQ